MNKSNQFQEQASNETVHANLEERITKTVPDNDHSRQRTPKKLDYSKPERRNSIASLVHVLTHLPMATAATIRYPFTQGSTKRDDDIGRCDDDGEASPSVEDTTSREEHLEDSFNVTVNELVNDLETRGKLIRRRRSKQFSKGRRANRKVKSTSFESRMNASDSSWDKLVKLVEGTSEDISVPSGHINVPEDENA